MATQAWDLSRAQTEITRLIAPGVLGHYTHFEATEVFALRDGQGSVANIFSIMVAEDRQNEPPQAMRYLTDVPMRLKSLKGWKFGIARYTQPIAELVPALGVLAASGEWRQSGKALTVGGVVPLSPQFAPPDASAPVPLNSVLKNNFWNGSHVFEWSDRGKTVLQPLFDNPQRLQELSEALQKWVPLGLASVSDRLGNLLIQLPVTVLMSKFGQRHGSNDFLVEIAWHPKFAPRELRAMCEMESDGVVCGFSSSAIQGPQTLLPMQTGRGLHSGVIWDDQHRILLAATGPSAFINTISIGMSVMNPEPRVFVTRQRDGAVKSHRIVLQGQPSMSVVGEAEPGATDDWTRRRMYADEMSRLEKERRFVHYRPKAGNSAADHEKALNDLRWLIDRHGQKGAWLWDPYLSAHDILETLFHCKYSGAELRALSGGEELTACPSTNQARRASVRQRLLAKLRKWLLPERRPAPSKEPDFAEKQRSELGSCESNWQGLRLEYRVRRGQAGWRFHDRFLIFPKTDREALAWSIGISVNSVGKAHHILQRVDNGQLVMDAFVELWNSLDKPEHLVWKKP